MLNSRSPHSLANRQRHGGLTLVELMVTIAIAAILLGVGVPSFRAVIEANRVTTVTNDVVGALQFARSEAVRRGAAITVCGSANGVDCNASWQGGWIARDGAGAVLRVWPPMRGGVTVVPAGALAAPLFGGVVYQPLGNVQGAQCYTISLNANIRRVNVGPAGRVQAERGVAC